MDELAFVLSDDDEIDVIGLCGDKYVRWIDHCRQVADDVGIEGFEEKPTASEAAMYLAKSHAAAFCVRNPATDVLVYPDRDNKAEIQSDYYAAMMSRWESFHESE